MSKQKIYTSIAVLLLIGIYAYEAYFEKKQEDLIINKAQLPKSNTNLFFLPASTTGLVIHHQCFSLSYHEDHEQAEWVAYELKKSQLSNMEFDRPYFEVDPAITSGAAHWRNYKNSGYDRGHLCPAADRRFSKLTHDETFLTSNTTPQEHEFNSGIWNRLEQKVRYWANKYNGVFVITGGVLEDDLETIGYENVSVPKQFYKIVLDNNSGKIKVIAFLIPHQESKKPLGEFVTSVDNIERLTGIDFFPKLEDTLEHKIEASKRTDNWSLN